MLKIDTLKNLIILFSSIIICLLILEILCRLFFTLPIPNNIEEAEKAGLIYDKRSKFQVINELRKKEKNIFPATYPIEWLKEEVREYEKIFPLSGLSYGKSVYCNENGNWSVLPNDIYGFNNPPEIYNKKIDVVILGDSFARGACLKIENSTAGYIRNYTNFNTTALANGGGPLIELATFIEYAAKIKPKYVFWFFYEGNDHENLLEEKNIPILMKYLDSNYEQNLILKQDEINAKIFNYLKKKEEEYLKNNLDELIITKVKDPKINKTKLIFFKIKDFLLLTRTRYMINVKVFNKKYSHHKYDSDLLKRILKKVKNISEKNNIEFYFVYIPTWQRNAFNLNDSYLHRDKLLKDINKLKINVIDLQLTLNNKDDPLFYYTFRKNNHFNKEGYKLIAKEMEKFLIK